MLTITPNTTDDTKATTFLSDEEISKRINAGIESGRAANRSQVYVDLEFGIESSPERDLKEAQIIVDLKNAGYPGAKFDGRTGHVNIRLRQPTPAY